MKIIKLLNSEEAVSEVVDFVTILGIMVVFIGLIGVVGYPLVKTAQEVNYVESTRQSYAVLAANINKVVLGQTPSQEVELKLYGGSLSITGNSLMNITANSTNISGYIERIILVNNTQMRTIESVVGETAIAYEGTGVWIKYPNGNTLLVYKPLITNQSNVLVIPVVSINGTASTGGSGMSRVIVKGRTPHITYYNNVSDIRVRINSSYADGWGKSFFGSIMNWTLCTDKAVCTAELDTPYNIDVYILNIQLDAEVI